VHVIVLLVLLWHYRCLVQLLPLFHLVKLLSHLPHFCLQLTNIIDLILHSTHLSHPLREICYQLYLCSQLAHFISLLIVFLGLSERLDNLVFELSHCFYLLLCLFETALELFYTLLHDDNLLSSLFGSVASQDVSGLHIEANEI